MIEFVLLFGLGFLTAALVAMLIAPAIHARIVRYTENRIKATLPISPQELRAQRDMARAVYAAENARVEQELRQERQRTGELRTRNDGIAEEARRLHGELAELRAQIAAMDVEAAEARSRLRRESSHVETLKAALEEAETAMAERDAQIENLRRRQSRVRSDADSMRLGLTTRDREMENLRAQIATLREERDALRDGIRLHTQRARDAQGRLSLEESRVRRLEEKLAREISERTDKEEALDRRLREIGRLREKLSAADAEVRETSRSYGTALSAVPTAERPWPRPNKEREKNAVDDAEAEMRQLPPGLPPARVRIFTPEADPVVLELAEEARNRATALAERIQNGRGDNDDQMRRELTAIAAGMVALTALAEGPSSPIHALLAEPGSGRRESLADRARAALVAASPP